jgi:hypothetical protein
MNIEKTSHDIAETYLVNKIYSLRNSRVMVDSDLAELYQVDTKRLNEQVRRNPDRFPHDFMFQMDQHEWESLRSQIATSKRGGRTYLPYVFTEHGILMLSSVLNSKKAIQVNIQIVRIFSKMRQLLNSTNPFPMNLDEIKERLNSHDKSIELMFTYLDGLNEKLQGNPNPRKRIGYKPDNI